MQAQVYPLACTFTVLWFEAEPAREPHYYTVSGYFSCDHTDDVEYEWTVHFRCQPSSSRPGLRQGAIQRAAREAVYDGIVLRQICYVADDARVGRHIIVESWSDEGADDDDRH